MSYGIKELQEEKRKLEKEKEKVRLTPEEFEIIIKEIYDTMLHYSRINKVYLSAGNPLEIGGVLFWFETSEDTGEAFLKFNRNAESWNKEYLRRDLDKIFHLLYYDYS